MKRLVPLLTAFAMVIGCLGWFGAPQAAFATNLAKIGSLGTIPKVLAVESVRDVVGEKMSTEFGQKIDLNNTNVRAFMKYPGLYPNLARIVIKNAPYKKVEEVLDIADLTDSQKDLLASYLDRFTVTDVEPALVEGQDRINPGIYR